LAICRDTVLWAYRLFQGREPVEAEIEEKIKFTSSARLLLDLLFKSNVFAASSDSPIIGDLKNAVVWAYRLTLGREPESETAVKEKMRAKNRLELLNAPPLPPLDLRRSVGPVEKEHWKNPSGGLIFGAQVPPESYVSVFDFGCGCGRTARQRGGVSARRRNSSL
jgi:hypothetical protein